MADLEKTIEIIFGARDDGFIGQIKTFDTAVQGIATPVGDFTKSLLKTEAAIAGAGAALLAFSINEAGTFKGSVNEIAALFNGTAEQADILGEDIKSFAADSVFAIETINQATFTAISTGTEWTKVTETLVVAERLAIAGSTDLATATATLSRTMNAYGFEAEEAERVSNALFVSAQQGDTNLTKLAGSFGNLAPTASAANIALDDSLAALSAITVTSGNTERSVTQLNALFRELASPSKELAAALGGVSLETDGLQAVMNQLLTATGGSQSEMDALFGSSEAVASALILAKDASGTFNTALDAMANKAGTVTAAYNAMEQDFTKINQKLANSFRLTLIEVGDDLLDEYGGIASALTSIFNSVGLSLDEGTLKQITDAVEVFAKDIEFSMQGLANALPEALESLDLDDLLSSFGLLVKDFGDIFDSVFGAGLDLSKPEDLAKALQVGINLAESFVNITRGIIEQFTPIFDAIGEAGQRLAGTGSETDLATGKLLGAVTALSEFGVVLGAFLVVINESQASISAVFDLVIGLGKTITNTLQVIFDGLVLALVSSLNQVVGLLNGVSFGTIPGLNDFSEDLDKLQAAVQANLGSNFTDLTVGLKQIVGVTDEAAESTKKLNTELVATPDKFVAIANDSKIAAANLSVFESALKSGATQTELNALSMDLFGKSFDGVADKVKDVEVSTKELSTSTGELLPNVISNSTAIDLFSGSAAKATTATNKTASAIKALAVKEKEAANEAVKLELKLATLASNESIARIEFSAQIQTAKIEADAGKIIAAFDSIAFSVSSTNTLIGELFSQDAPDWDVFGIQTKIAVLEAQKQAKALNEAQVELIEAQSESIREQTRLLADGGSTVTINADDLAPELQQVLKSLIDNIRIETINNGLEFIV